MPRRSIRTVTYACVTVGVLVLLVAGIALKDVVLERVYLHRLEATDLAARTAAAKGLGEVGSRLAVAPLAAIVQDEAEEKELRVVSALALAQIGEEAIPTLLDALSKAGSLRDDIETAVVDAAGESEGALLVMLAVPLWNPDKKSAQGTGPGTALFTTARSASRSRRKRVSGTLVTNPGSVGLTQQQAPGQTSQDCISRTVSRLKDIHPDPVTVLVNALQCPYSGVLYGAARVLAALGTNAEEAVPAVIDALRDPRFREHPRGSATIGPMAVAGCDGRLPLVSVLRQNRGLYQHEILPVLLELLQDSEWCIAQAATEALGKMGVTAAEAVPAILQKFQDGENAPTSAEVEALVRIREGAVKAMPVFALALTSSDTTLRRRACGVLRGVGANAQALVPEFLEAFANEQAEFRPRKTARCLECLDVSLSDPFIDALASDNPRVRQGATRALGQMAAKYRASIPHLVEALSHEESRVREGVATALGHIDFALKNVISALEALLDRDKETVRKAAAASLERIRNLYR